MRTITFAQATLEAMAVTMEEDPAVFVMGEDIARQGGIFGQFKDLARQFPDRVIDTPISETFIVGGGVGAALAGARPVVDMHYADFLSVAMDEVFNQMAKARFMFGGQAKMPIVLRAPDGQLTNGAAQHTQSVEAWFTHIPGLKVVSPSNPYDAKMTLITAIRSDDPVIYFENKTLYIGEEAIAAGVCAALRQDDLIESTHRGHGHCIAKGADIDRMMAEIYGKETGLCHGRGGSMHIADFSVGMLGANGVVGGGYNLAVGAALANRRIFHNDKVSVVFFGDGAANRGTFHEALNAASAWKLPVVFVNEMNHWASTTPYRTTCNLEYISQRAAGYQIPGVTVDGQDVLAVYAAAQEAVDRARRGEGPTLLEARTYRIEGHFVGDPEVYRDHDETMRIFRETDPLKRFREKAVRSLHFTEAELDEADAACVQRIADAKRFALESPYPDAADYQKYLYAD